MTHDPKLVSDTTAAMADAEWLRRLARNEPTNSRRDHMRAMADRIERREQQLRSQPRQEGVWPEGTAPREWNADTLAAAVERAAGGEG